MKLHFLHWLPVRQRVEFKVATLEKQMIRAKYDSRTCAKHP